MKKYSILALAFLLTISKNLPGQVPKSSELLTSFQLSKAPYVGQYSTAAFSVTKQKNHKGELYYVVIPIQ